MKYFANDYEKAVIKENENGLRFVKFLGKKEFLAYQNSKVAYGSQEIDLVEISKQEYDTYGIKWVFDKYLRKIKV